MWKNEMVRDWCQYKGEDVSEDVGEGGEDILSMLLLFNLDHCVDLIAGSSCVLMWNCELKIEFSGHLDVFSLGTAACVCSSWRKWGLFVLEFFNLIEVFISKEFKQFLNDRYFQHLLSPSLTCRAWQSPLPSPTFLHCRFSEVKLFFHFSFSLLHIPTLQVFWREPFPQIPLWLKTSFQRHCAMFSSRISTSCVWTSQWRGFKINWSAFPLYSVVKYIIMFLHLLQYFQYSQFSGAAVESADKFLDLCCSRPHHSSEHLKSD